MTLSLSEIHSKPFKCLISDIPYIAMVNEIESKITLNIKETKYFHYLSALLKANGKVWGYIFNENDCIKRAEAFIELIKSIKENGFNDEPKIMNINGLPYGKITVIQEDQKIKVVDGHHRVAILINLGIKYFEIKENYLIPMINERTKSNSNSKIKSILHQA